MCLLEKSLILVAGQASRVRKIVLSLPLSPKEEIRKARKQEEKEI
jgi:hypothetical protein